MDKLLLATGNVGKMREIEALLHGLEVELVIPASLGLILEVKEEGSSYRENAARKALTFSAKAGLLTLADDSGLEVEALDGQPGIFSARFALKTSATDADRREYLLQKLQGIPGPWTAKFRCVVAIATPLGDLSFYEGLCQGLIIPEERGENGFGYDPIFFIPEIGKTMAELTMEEKNRLSHRARAVIAALPLIRRWMHDKKQPNGKLAKS